MNKKSNFKNYHYIDVLSGLIYNLGISLEYGSDFSEFRNILLEQPDRNPVNPAFNPAYCDLGVENAFWLLGKNQEGEIIHTQAIKLLDLGNESLQSHFETHIWDFRSHGYDFDNARTQFFLSPEASRINGRVTYHGEAWIKPGRDGYRGGSLITLLTRLMLLKAFYEWMPDFFIGLQAPATSCRGLSIREGYMRAEQRSIIWHETTKGTPPQEDWMVWMSREEANFNLRIPPEYFYEMFKKNTDPELPIRMKLSA